MERLIQKNINSGEEYDRIYFERKKAGEDRQDMRRWKKLIKPFKGGRIIDLGCLDSRIYSLLKKRLPYVKIDYLGVDIAAKAVEDMQKIYPDETYAKFQVLDVYNTGLPSESFDYAVLGELIEHLEEPKKAVDEAMRILRKGGTLALSTPLEEAVEPGAVDKDRHLWSFNANDIIELLGGHGSVRMMTLGSEYFPKYIYHFPTVIAWCQKAA